MTAYFVVHNQKAVTAHFSSKQLLYFAYAEQYCPNLSYQHNISVYSVIYIVWYMYNAYGISTAM